MAITNDTELRKATEDAGALLQQIHDYCVSQNKTIADMPDAQVRFPRGFIRSAAHQRRRFRFLNNYTLKCNISYTLILSDTIVWLAIRTDVSGTAKDMLLKLFTFLVTTVIESTTKEYLRGVCGKSFKRRNQYLLENDIIKQELKNELDWLWDVRNKMHLFLVRDREWENNYDMTNHKRVINAFRELLQALELHHEAHNC